MAKPWIFVTTTAGECPGLREQLEGAARLVDRELCWHPETDRTQPGILELCQREIAGADCVVCIVGLHYAELLPGERRSFGHAQVELALELQRGRVLAYDFAVPGVEGPRERARIAGHSQMVNLLKANGMNQDTVSLDRLGRRLREALRWLLEESRIDRRVVLISSTHDDLAEDRAEVYNAFANIKRSSTNPRVPPCIMFEDLPLGLDPEATSRRLAEQAGAYISLLSDYRGSKIHGRDCTFTELEYEQASTVRDLPVFVFSTTRPPRSPALVSGQSPDDLVKAREFSRRLADEHPPVHSYGSVDDLFSRALDVFAKADREGKLFLLGDDGEGSAGLPGSGPIPPEPLYVQDYNLAVDSGLVGRERQLGRLDAWVTDARSATRMLGIEALGGMGKSALAWTWVNDLAKTGRGGFEAIVWYSFYAVESGAHDFAESVLPYLSRLQGVDDITVPVGPPLQKVLKILERRRVLLILDGVERLQKLYVEFEARGKEGAALTALIEERAERHKRIFSGLPEEVTRQLAEEDLYALAPEEARMFEHLTGPIASRTLLTSRFIPTQLKARRPVRGHPALLLPSGGFVPGFEAFELRPFDQAQAEELAGRMRVPWQPEFEALWRASMGYPLYLALGFAYVARGSGNETAEPRRRALARALRLEPDAARIAVVTLGIQDLDERQQQILFELEACPIPTAFSELQGALCQRDQVFARPSELEAQLRLLHARRLIGWDRLTGSCDMHPVVRQAVRLQGTPEIEERLRGRHAAGSETGPVVGVRVSAEVLTRLNLGLRDESSRSATLRIYLDLIDPIFRYRSPQIHRRREWLEKFLGYEPRLSLPERVVLHRELADTLNLLADLATADDHASRACHLARQSGEARLLGLASQQRANIAIARGHLLEADELLIIALQNSNLEQQEDYTRWALCSKAGMDAELGRPDEAQAILELLRRVHGDADADVLLAEFYVACAQQPRDEQARDRALAVLRRYIAVCAEKTLYYGRMTSLAMAADFALLFDDGGGPLETTPAILENHESHRYKEALLAIRIKRARLAVRRGHGAHALEEAQRVWEGARAAGFRSLETEAGLAIAEASWERGEAGEAEFHAREAASLANADGAPYCFRLLLGQIEAFFTQKLQQAMPPVPACSAGRIARLPAMPPLPEPPPPSASPSLPLGITDTRGWTDETVLARLGAVRPQLDWDNTTGSARKWWEAFEAENTHRNALVLRLAEELLLRRATITEFFLAYVYSNTDNIQANLEYLDYTRLKKEEERKKKAEAAKEPYTPLFVPPPETGLPPGITDTRGWTAEAVRARLAEVRGELDWEKTTGSARKWWEAFEREQAHRIALVLRLADELKARRATVTEFFLAYVYSNTDNIKANLHYLDYTRLKKEEDRKKKEARAKLALARLQALLPALTAGGPPPPLTAEDAKLLGEVPKAEVPAAARTPLRRALEAAAQRLAEEQEKQQAIELAASNSERK